MAPRLGGPAGLRAHGRARPGRTFEPAPSCGGRAAEVGSRRDETNKPSPALRLLPRPHCDKDPLPLGRENLDTLSSKPEALKPTASSPESLNPQSPDPENANR